MAGPYYVDSNRGGGGDTGADWTNAFLTFAQGVAAAAAGERIYVDDGHQETLAADTTYTFAGTEGVPVEVIVAVTDTTNAVADYNCTNQYIEGDTGNYHIIIAGEVYFWGICLEWGDSSTFVANGKTVVFEKCNLKVESTVGKYLKIRYDNTTVILINTDVVFAGDTGHKFMVQECANFIWRGGILTGDVDTLFDLENEANYIELTGIDLSVMIGGTIITVAEGDERFHAYLKGIKLNATQPALITSGISPERASRIHMDIADDGNTVYKFRREFQYGYAMQETSLTVAGKGLYDGTNPYSVKLASRAAPVCTYYDPWRYHLATKRVTGLGAGKTFTVYILENGNGGQSAAWNNDEVWLEVIYPDATTAQYNIQTDKKATPTTAAAAQTDDAGRWQNETNGREQKLEVTVANGEGKDGPVEIWVCIANANKFLYACPEVIVS